MADKYAVKTGRNKLINHIQGDVKNTQHLKKLFLIKIIRNHSTLGYLADRVINLLLIVLQKMGFFECLKKA